jgi:putative spermidine/putrescine transport system substrate-binding protein
MRRLSVALVTFVLVTGCIGSNNNGSGGSSAYKTATSAQTNGGMNALVSAAKAEGKLNLIATPRDWADYGAIIDGFSSKYGISVTVDDPTGTSKEEIQAIQQLGTSRKAPDVVDLELVDALANTKLFAPYKVAVWSDIPTQQKEQDGLWYEDYGGYMSIGYDSSKFPPVTSLSDLLQPAFKGKVSLKGYPLDSSEGLDSVMMASLAYGGSPDDISQGVSFFHQLKAAGAIGSVHATTGTVKSGATPVVFDWDYLSLGHLQDIPSWTVVVPSNAVLAQFFAQAINKNASHPAAARLWEEYLYSNDGQNLLLSGQVRPVRMAAMLGQGKLDQSAAAVMPSVTGVPVFLSSDQAAAAKKYLTGHWLAAMTCAPPPSPC